MEKLPGKGMVTASSLIMLIWGLVNAGYYDIAKLVLTDTSSTKAVVCGIVAGIASLAAIIAGSNKVAKASAIVVWAAFLLVFAIISGIVSLVTVDSKLIAVIMLIVGIVVPVVMFMGAAKNRGV